MRILRGMLAPLELVEKENIVNVTQLFVNLRNVEDLGMGRSVPFQANAEIRELSAS